MIKTIHICDKCGTEFNDPIPSIKCIYAAQDLYLQITVMHGHCKFDMCNKCKDEVLRAYVQNLDSR